MTIKQMTAKNVLEVLQWVVANPHHVSSACDAKHPDCMVLKGYHAKLIIKPQIKESAYKHLTYSQNIRRFDTRMYLPNDDGVWLLSEWLGKRVEDIIEQYALR